MPRHADPALEQRILNAARKLWKQGGEHALTMRAVAKEARTTTPTVYERFRNRRQILQTLCVNTRQKLFSVLKKEMSTREACEAYLEFAAKHPHEYELISAGWSKPPSVNEQWPSFNLLKERLALRYGGKPDDYTRFALSVWALLHGTAMLIVAGKTPVTLQLQMRLACVEAIEALGTTLEKSNGRKN
ncbi:MAG TPA: TetR/AcrR family transcriptional regulator [Terriglobales bacterium]|nr:TetR/AcrR family transcriptional regulator [Terriglobales bacterium]